MQRCSTGPMCEPGSESMSSPLCIYLRAQLSPAFDAGSMITDSQLNFWPTILQGGCLGDMGGG
jgi:hypothetical protein